MIGKNISDFEKINNPPQQEYQKHHQNNIAPICRLGYIPLSFLLFLLHRYNSQVAIMR